MSAAARPSANWIHSVPEGALIAPGPCEVHVWWMDLATPPWEPESLAASLDPEEAACAARFRFERHRRRFVAAHGQMRELLGAYVGIAPKALRFCYGIHGKPMLVQCTAPKCSVAIGFNMSHSADHGLLAVANTAAVGADIEATRDVPDFDNLTKGHFTDGELREFHSLPVDRRQDAFFAAWTRKEAYAKAVGKGLSMPFDSFEISLHPDWPAELRHIHGSKIGAMAWTLWSDKPTPSTWAAVAVRIPNATVRTFSLSPLPTERASDGCAQVLNMRDSDIE